MIASATVSALRSGGAEVSLSSEVSVQAAKAEALLQELHYALAAGQPQRAYEALLACSIAVEAVALSGRASGSWNERLRRPCSAFHDDGAGRSRAAGHGMMELLLEIRTEPDASTPRLELARQLAISIKRSLAEVGSDFETVETSVTPRRMSLVFRSAISPDAEAIDRSVLCERIESRLAQSPLARGPGRGAGVLCCGLLALLDGEPLELELGGVKASPTTVGHFALSPRSFKVTGVESYRESLAKLGIEIQHQERERRLGIRLSEKASELGGTVVEDRQLLRLESLACEDSGCPRLLSTVRAPGTYPRSW